MLETFAREKFRLGVIAGFVYADDRVNAFIADEAHRDQIVPVSNDAQNLQNLLAGVIDGFLADRIVAATTAWRRHEGARIEEHPLRFSANIHFMLSRATQTPQMLARLNDAIDELRRSGELRRIADAYALPVLINQTLDSEWFRVLAFIGIVAFALSGVVLAMRANTRCSALWSLPRCRRSAAALCAICCCSVIPWESSRIPRRC
jgi:polar amino acid transport system substrate-binding protein